VGAVPETGEKKKKGESEWGQDAESVRHHKRGTINPLTMTSAKKKEKIHYVWKKSVCL